MNSDGSGLVGGLYNGVGQALQLDSSGNLKIVGSISATNPSVGTNGSAIPTSSTQIGASDGTNLQQLLVESATQRNLRTSLYIAGVQLAADQSNTELRTSLYGKSTTAGDTAIKFDSSGRPQINIDQWNGATPGLANPVIDEDIIRAYIAAGQGFMATTGKQTSGGALQAGMAIWNNNTAKNVLIYSIKVGDAASGVHTLYLGTADPGLSGLTVTGYNAKAAGAAPVGASTQGQNTAITVGGTYNQVDTTYGLANQGSEMLLSGAIILLPASAINGLLLSVSTATNVWQASMKWVEF
jgi:hypothetical protein